MKYNMTNILGSLQKTWHEQSLAVCP